MDVEWIIPSKASDKWTIAIFAEAVPIKGKKILSCKKDSNERKILPQQGIGGSP